MAGRTRGHAIVSLAPAASNAFNADASSRSWMSQQDLPILEWLHTPQW